MLLRFVLLAILIAVVIRFVLRLGRVVGEALREGSSPSLTDRPPAVALVPCRRCGVFVPRHRARAAAPDGFLCGSCDGA